MILTFEIIQKENIIDKHRKIFAELLKKQGKVGGDYQKKADRCKTICIVTCDNLPIAIGAIKEKTKSDFSSAKADLLNLEKLFEWELGYLYTDKSMTGKGIANQITKLLISDFGNYNLMASTELNANPSMVSILLRNGFEKYGNPYKSELHENMLGLYLKFGKKTA